MVLVVLMVLSILMAVVVYDAVAGFADVLISTVLVH